MLQTTTDVHTTSVDMHETVNKEVVIESDVSENSSFVMVRSFQMGKGGKVEVIWNKVPSKVAFWK